MTIGSAISTCCPAIRKKGEIRKLLGNYIPVMKIRECNENVEKLRNFGRFTILTACFYRKNE